MRWTATAIGVCDLGGELGAVGNLGELVILLKEAHTLHIHISSQTYLGFLEAGSN